MNMQLHIHQSECMYRAGCVSPEGSNKDAIVQRNELNERGVDEPIDQYEADSHNRKSKAHKGECRIGRKSEGNEEGQDKSRSSTRGTHPVPAEDNKETPEKGSTKVSSCF